MKRTKLARGTKPLSRDSASLKRSNRMRVLGRRGHEARKALASVRAEVLERAGWRCERCGAGGKLDLHHRMPRSRGGTHEAGNLAVLCGGAQGCHALAHAHLIADWADWIVTARGVA